MTSSGRGGDKGFRKKAQVTHVAKEGHQAADLRYEGKTKMKINCIIKNFYFSTPWLIAKENCKILF